MHRQIAADAVAGAVLEIDSGLPQELPRQRVELRAGGAVGKHRARDRDMAAQHAGETVAHFRRWFADRDGAGDVGGAVLVLRAGIDQQQIAGRDPPVGLAGDAVMHDGAVRTRCRRWSETKRPSARRCRGGRFPAPPLRRSRSAGPPAPRGRSRRETAPAQPRRAGAPYACPRSRSDSCTALSSATGSLPRTALPPALSIRRLSASAAVALSSATCAPRCASAVSSPVSASGSRDVGGSFEMVARAVGELAVIDEHGWPAVLRHQRVGQRQRRMRDVGAADVEGPGHCVGIRQHQRVDAKPFDLAADALKLFALAFAGKLRAVNGDRAERRRGRSAHTESTGLVSTATSSAPGLGAGGGQPFGCP